MLEVDRLFDGVHADYRRHVDVHVRAGRIAAISARGVVPAQGKVIALPNATVIPGLIDVHAHQTSLAGERLGRAWLAYGVTTVREIAAERACSTATRGGLGHRPHAGSPPDRDAGSQRAARLRAQRSARARAGTARHRERLCPHPGQTVRRRRACRVSPARRSTTAWHSNRRSHLTSSSFRRGSAPTRTASAGCSPPGQCSPQASACLPA